MYLNLCAIGAYHKVILIMLLYNGDLFNVINVFFHTNLGTKHLPFR